MDAEAGRLRPPLAAELERVPDGRLVRPWTMTGEEQARARGYIGREYAAPIVDHAVERRRAIERYEAVGRP